MSKANGKLMPVDQRRIVSRLFTVFFEFGTADGCCGYVTLRAKNKTEAKKQWLAENPDDRITKVINGRIRFKFVYSANAKSDSL